MSSRATFKLYCYDEDYDSDSEFVSCYFSSNQTNIVRQFLRHVPNAIWDPSRKMYEFILDRDVFEQLRPRITFPSWFPFQNDLIE